MEKKRCSRCKKTKNIKEFRIRTNGKYNNFCIQCNKEYGREHYKNNKQYYYERNKKARIELRKWYIEYKSHLQCEICGENHPACIDFHHKESSFKTDNISQAFPNWSKKRILEEIKKCRILCANCHRKLHYEETHSPEV